MTRRTDLKGGAISVKICEGFQVATFIPYSAQLRVNFRDGHLVPDA